MSDIPSLAASLTPKMREALLTAEFRRRHGDADIPGGFWMAVRNGGHLRARKIARRSTYWPFGNRFKAQCWRLTPTGLAVREYLKSET